MAVISYTGYDMEDAMIICKQSMQRGFKHGTVYVTKVIDLTKLAVPNLEGIHWHFNNLKADGSLFEETIPQDGIPAIGRCFFLFVCFDGTVCASEKIKQFLVLLPTIVKKYFLINNTRKHFGFALESPIKPNVSICVCEVFLFFLVYI